MRRRSLEHTKRIGRAAAQATRVGVLRLASSSPTRELSEDVGQLSACPREFAALAAASRLRGPHWDYPTEQDVIDTVSFPSVSDVATELLTLGVEVRS
jgi:hypothetical protein